MRFDDLSKPISPDEPCGQDLLEEGDGDFLGYYYDAESKMPDRYVSLATGEPFDRTSIELKSEQKAIAGLLSRTIDLRLLALDARFSILAGRIKPFCEAVIAMANVLDAHGDDVHPVAGDDPFERQAAIEFLDTRPAVVAPLEHAPIVVDRRAGEVTFRAYLVASGQVEPREGEHVSDAAVLSNAIGSSDSASDVDEIFGLLQGAQDAFGRIKAASVGFTPSLDAIEAKVKQIIDFIGLSRSDLAGGGDDVTTDAAGGDVSVGDDGPTVAAAAVSSGPPAVAGSIQNHQDARESLRATEAYFRTFEPSSPAMILVRQARLLVGRPLVEAMMTLLPGPSQQAVIDLGSDTGFQIPMPRMTELSQSAMGEGKDSEDSTEARSVESRDQAMAEIKSVEAFYQAMEPASPIPVLMFKARSFMNRDFQSIVRDLIPQRNEDKE